MIKKEITLAKDMDARCAELFVRTCSNYLSDIMLELESKNVSAKSVMGVLSLLLKKSMKITIVTNGEDEDKAIEEIAGKFGEQNV